LKIALYKVMQIFADMYGVTTVRNKVNGSASLGAAICVAVATGVYSSFEEAVKNMVAIRDEFVPNIKNTEIYNRINSNIYRELPKLMENTLKIAFSACN
jgi:sugar (pentulose or hexulose) kinase